MFYETILYLILDYILFIKICTKYRFFHNLHTLICMLLYIISPEPDNSPAFEQQSLIYFIIPLSIMGYFANPEFAVIAFFQSWF